MANGWGKNGNSGRFYFHGLQITADGNCIHEIKRRLHLGRKTLTNVDSILKSRDIILPTKVHMVKTMVCPLVMSKCESWTIKKAEHWSTDAFKLRVPLTARRSNELILINPEYSLEGLMLKLQCFGHLMQIASSLEKNPDAGEARRSENKGKTED